MKQSPVTNRRWFVFALCAALLAAVLMLLFYVNTPRSSPIIAAATATRAVSAPAIVDATPKIAATHPPTSEGLAALNLAFSQMRTVRIIEDWQEMATPGIYHMEYTLNYKNGILSGQEMLSVGYEYPKTATFTVNIPRADTGAFLSTLAHIDGLEGKYSSPSQIDKGSSLTIEIVTDTSTITFNTGGHLKTAYSYFERALSVDWGIEFNGRTYLSASPLPLQAYQKLIPYLHQNVMSSLSSQWLASEAQATRDAFDQQTAIAYSTQYTGTTTTVGAKP